MRCRDLMHSTWFKERWGDRFRMTKWTENHIKNDRQGFRLASSVGGVGTGERVHRVINDDLLRAQDAHSEAMRVQAINHMEAMSTRGVNPATFAQVLIMQRLHEEDPTGWALSQEAGWEHLMLPMEFEPTRKCETSIGFSDPRTEEGELLWPEHFPAQVVEDLKASLNTYGAAAQLQQSPAPLGGGIIKGSAFGRYDVLPKIKYRMIFADTANKTKTYNDYSVFQCWGLGEDNKLYLIDQIRGKWEAPDLKQQAKDFWAKHKAIKGYGALRKLNIEDAASGTGLI